MSSKTENMELLKNLEFSRQAAAPVAFHFRGRCQSVTLSIGNARVGKARLERNGWNEPSSRLRAARDGTSCVIFQLEVERVPSC